MKLFCDISLLFLFWITNVHNGFLKHELTHNVPSVRIGTTKPSTVKVGNRHTHITNSPLAPQYCLFYALSITELLSSPVFFPCRVAGRPDNHFTLSGGKLLSVCITSWIATSGCVHGVWRVRLRSAADPHLTTATCQLTPVHFVVCWLCMYEALGNTQHTAYFLELFATDTLTSKVRAALLGVQMCCLDFL